MATANPTEVSSAPVHKDEKYERIVLEPQPNMEKEIEEAKELLDLALCSVPNEDDEKYEEEGNEGLYEKDLEEIATRTKKLLHKDFPYTAYVPSDETVLEKPIFKDYTGAVYWNDCGRDFIIDPNQSKENFKPENMAKLVYHSLKPIKIYEGGDKPLTVQGLCDGVAKLKFNPGDCHFLGDIDVQLRENDDKARWNWLHT